YRAADRGQGPEPRGDRREAVVGGTDRALSRAQRCRPRPLLRALPAPRLARRALLVVVHDAHAPLPTSRDDRREAQGRGARLSAPFGSGTKDDRRELRRAAARLRRSVAASRTPSGAGARTMGSAGRAAATALARRRPTPSIRRR